MKWAVIKTFEDVWSLFSSTEWRSSRFDTGLTHKKAVGKQKSYDRALPLGWTDQHINSIHKAHVSYIQQLCCYIYQGSSLIVLFTSINSSFRVNVNNRFMPRLLKTTQLKCYVIFNLLLKFVLYNSCFAIFSSSAAAIGDHLIVTYAT